MAKVLDKLVRKFAPVKKAKPVGEAPGGVSVKAEGLGTEPPLRVSADGVVLSRVEVNREGVIVKVLD